MIKALRTLAAAILLVMTTIGSAGQLSARDPDASQSDLRAETREDILDAYRILAAHHPGMYNPFDPDFAEKLERARDEALLAASQVEDSVDRLFAIEVINRALSDGHARVHIGFNGGPADWPGFHAEWRGDGLYVTSVSEKGPTRGSKLHSCDGTPADDLIREEVFKLSGRENEAGQWWQRGVGFFRRGDLSRSPAPQMCRFQRPDGTIAMIEMEWKPYPREEATRRLAEKERRPVGMSIAAEGIRWITLSSFSPGPDGIAAYEQIFSEIRAQSEAMEDARAIVLDLRGNQGGSSTWSRKIAEELWGEEAVGWAMADYFRDTEVWYLADEGNLAYFGSLGPKLRERGLPEIAEWADELHGSLGAANAEGETFYKQPYGRELLAEAQPVAPRSLPPVYVIIDGGCVSACLDAVDTFTRFEGVKLVGAPTSADTEYLEIRREPLPSGRGSVVLPTKIWVNRPRRSGEVYRPDLLVTDLDWTTETMVEHILRDLDGGGASDGSMQPMAALMFAFHPIAEMGTKDTGPRHRCRGPVFRNC